MPRSEFARRISAMEPGHLNRVATRHFWDKVIYIIYYYFRIFQLFYGDQHIFYKLHPITIDHGKEAH